ncbi:mitogen-activated protein kinase binding protein 1 [Linnemannia zychae]|nr:mitogen-activated protein kinase binding protein 1 [Linnemannia zychae]
MRRRRKDLDCMLKLERVLGLTSNKPMILSINSTYDLVAYAAGCVVVLYNHKLDKQVGLLCSSTLNKVSSANSTSGDGLTSASGPGSYHSGMLGPGGSGVGIPRSIASLGSSPRAMAGTQWMNNPMAGSNINPLAGLAPMSLAEPSSSIGASNPNSNKSMKPKPISCLSFSPDGQFLAIGETGHQPRILIWEVASQLLVGELQGHKFGVQAVHFSPNSKFVVSLGFQHDGYIHVWNWRTNTQIASNKVTSKVNALAFSADGTYFVTAGLRHIKFWYLNVGPNKKAGSSSIRVLDGRSGILGELRDNNYVDAVCSKDGRFTYAISSSGILCLFSEGRAMEKWIDLHVRGAYSINLDEKYIICACTDGFIRLFEPETLQYIVTLPKPSPVGTFGVQMSQDTEDELPQNEIIADVLATQLDTYSSSLILPEPSIDKTEENLFPPETFITFSADGSILFWNLNDNVSTLPPSYDPNRPSSIDTNTTSQVKEIIRALYVDENCKSWIQSPETQDGTDPGFNIVPLECGVRTVKISPDGKLLASGDKGGNLRIHSLSTLKQLTYQEAHDTEILAIDFTDSEVQGSPVLVATAGRDRLLHVFDVLNDYALVQTLDDHSSSITCIKFAADGSRMMSCGADKSIIFRSCQKNNDVMSFQPYHQAPGRATFYDMALHSPSQTISVVSGDRRFGIYALESGKPIHTFKAETKANDLTAGFAEVCSMTHLSMDPTGTIAAASGSDKSIRIYDLLHGTCLAHTIAHSELVTGVRFTNRFNRVISTSADGCVLVWRLSKDIVRRIQSRILENVTLPSYLQAKAAEKLSVPSSSITAGASPKSMRIKKSTDRLGAYASDYSNASRRNSTASLMSDDFDLRSDIQSDDWNGSQQQQQQQQLRSRNLSRETRLEDISNQDFTPVSVPKSMPTKTTAIRTRITTASSVKPHLTRSRQNSTSQPVTPKSNLSSCRSITLPELPPWNKNIVKEKVVIQASDLTSRRPNDPTSPRQRVTKSLVKGKWLATPSNPRPRAISLTVSDEKSLISLNPNSQETTEQQERHALSDHTPRGHSSTANDNSADDDELSDEYAPPELCASPVKDMSESDIPTSIRPKMNSLGEILSPAGSLASDNIDSLQLDNNTVHATTAGTESEDEAVEQEIGGSDEIDGDDEEADVESIIDSASDHDDLSALSRNRSPGMEHMDLSGPIEVSGSFEEGERLRSPKSGVSSTQSSPLSRRASTKPSGPGRRSLSAKFLTAHAMTVMLGLAQKSRQEHSEDFGDGELIGDNLQEIASNDTTPTQEEDKEIGLTNSGDLRQSIAAEEEAANVNLQLSDSIQSDPKETVPDPINEDQTLSFEERLNPISLNRVAMKRRQRSITISSASAASSLLTRFHDDRVPIQSSLTSAKAQSTERSAAESGDVSKEVERTRKHLHELGYLSHSSTLTDPHRLSSMNPVVIGGYVENPEDLESSRKSDKVPTKQILSMGANTETTLSPPPVQSSSAKGILTSPAHVSSPIGRYKTSQNSAAVAPYPGQTDGQARTQASLNLALSGANQNDWMAAQMKYGSTMSNIADSRSDKGENEDTSLKEAFARISFLISHKAKSIMVRMNAGDDVSAEHLAGTEAWMKETRDGLLKLVGEAQGHLWMLEQTISAGNDDME